MEVKNVNSFRFLQKAIEYEIARQTAVVGEGGVIVQETRLFDPDTGRTFAMRSKEEAHDYRYFPEPDLPLLVLAPGQVDTRARVAARAAGRASRTLRVAVWPAGLRCRRADAGRRRRGVFRAGGRVGTAKLASNWVMGEVLRKVKDDDTAVADVPVTPAGLAELVRLVDDGTISTAAARQVFETMWTTRESASVIVEREGLKQVGDESALLAHVAAVIAANPDAVASYRAGRVQAIGALVGQVMKLTRGTANPKVVHALIQRQLDA